MLHHLSLAVADIDKSAKFYDACLACLGYRRVAESDSFIGYGEFNGKDRFAIAQQDEAFALPTSGFHLAFAAKDRETVDQFYKSAIENGGKNNGMPGIRENYAANYYAAFIIDPDGYHIEVVVNH